MESCTFSRVKGRFSITVEHKNDDVDDVFRDLDPFSPTFTCSDKSKDLFRVPKHTEEEMTLPASETVKRFHIYRSHISEEEKLRNSSGEKEFLDACRTIQNVCRRRSTKVEDMGRLSVSF